MPKVVDHQKYRERLLTQCFDVFAKKGYSSLTMRELASELGVSTGTLYHYWSGKQEVFDQLVIHFAEQDKSRFLQMAGQPKSLKKRLEALFSFIAANEEYFLKQHLIMMDYFRQYGRDAVLQNPVIQQSNLVYRQGMSDFLGIDDENAVVFVLNYLMGIVIGRLYEGDFISINDQGRMLARMLKLYLAESKEKK